MCFHLELLKYMFHVFHKHMKKLKAAVFSCCFFFAFFLFFPVGSVVTWDKLLDSLCLSSYDNSSVPNSVTKLGLNFAVEVPEK